MRTTTGARKFRKRSIELLTEQYELTKIQEVKETPSVKVLDRPKVAQKKSSPPRMLITLLGTFFTFCAGCGLGRGVCYMAGRRSAGPAPNSCAGSVLRRESEDPMGVA